MSGAWLRLSCVSTLLTTHTHTSRSLYLATQYIYRAYLHSIYSIYCATPGRRTRAAAHQQHSDQLETIIQINLNPSHHQQRHYLYQHSQLNCQHLPSIRLSRMPNDES